MFVWNAAPQNAFSNTRQLLHSSRRYSTQVYPQSSAPAIFHDGNAIIINSNSPRSIHTTRSFFKRLNTNFNRSFKKCTTRPRPYAEQQTEILRLAPSRMDPRLRINLSLALWYMSVIYPETRLHTEKGENSDLHSLKRSQQQKYYLLSNKFWDLTSRSNPSTWDATGSMWIVPSLNNKCMDSLTNRLWVRIEGHDLLEVENIFNVFNT